MTRIVRTHCYKRPLRRRAKVASTIAIGLCTLAGCTAAPDVGLQSAVAVNTHPYTAADAAEDARYREWVQQTHGNNGGVLGQDVWQKAQVAGLAPSPPAASSSVQGRTEVALSRSGGILTVPVRINDMPPIGFVVDSGAADVVIPADVMMTLLRTGTLRETDFLGRQTYVLADGSTLPSLEFRIRSLKVGDTVLENVTGSVAPASSEPLLGQSFLHHFRSWSIDNARDQLVLG